MGLTLDLRGLACPLPVLRANRALRDLDPGNELTVLATDSAAPKDFESFCQQTSNTFVGCTEDDGTYTIVVRKKDG